MGFAPCIESARVLQERRAPGKGKSVHVITQFALGGAAWTSEVPAGWALRVAPCVPRAQILQARQAAGKK